MLNIRNVIAVLKKSEFVGIYSDENINMVTNGFVLLPVTNDELWEVQTSLKFKECGWYEMKTKKIIKDFPIKSFDIIDNAKNADSVTLVDTNLLTKTNQQAYSILSRDGAYIIINESFVTMFDKCELKQDINNKLSPILVNGKYIITPMRNIINEYMKDNCA